VDCTAVVGARSAIDEHGSVSVRSEDLLFFDKLVTASRVVIESDDDDGVRVIICMDGVPATPHDLLSGLLVSW
jgi:hypothetical protein